MENILKKIIDKKKERVIEYKNKFLINTLLNNIKDINFFSDFKKK